MATGMVKNEAVQDGASASALFCITGVFSTAIAGYLSDRLGRTAVIIAMMVISIACSFSFGWLIGGSMVLIVIIGLCYGFSVIAESPVYTTGLSEVVPPNYLGAALGLQSLVGFSIVTLVPTVFGAILDLTNPAGVEKSADYLQNWGWAFCVLGAGALIGPWAMLKLRSYRKAARWPEGRNEKQKSEGKNQSSKLRK